MRTLPLPDLASSVAVRRQGAEARAALQRAANELASGRREDLVAASGGDPALLIAIERGQSRAAVQIDALALAGMRASSAQAALGRVEALSSTIGPPLLAAVERGDVLAAEALAAEAESAFSDVVDRLNTRVGGRALFAGAEVGGAALADAESMLAALRTAGAGAVDGADLAARIADWFDAPGGGFESLGFLGDGEAARVRLGEGVEADISVRADAPELRAVLKSLALAAVAADPAFGATTDMAQEAFAIASSDAILATEGVVRLRADLGLSEARIEEADLAARSHRASLDIAWNDAVSRDPFEAASEFQELETQLQTSYTVAARLSRLTLADFLR